MSLEYWILVIVIMTLPGLLAIGLTIGQFVGKFGNWHGLSVAARRGGDVWGGMGSHRDGFPSRWVLMVLSFHKKI